MTQPLDGSMGAEEFLRRAGADSLPHAHGRALLDHLLETGAILRRWRQPAWLQDAGALHSIYATDVYQRQLVPLSRRDEVRAAVGPRAERLAYLFGAVSRQRFFELLAAREGPSDAPLAVPARPSGPDAPDATEAMESISRDEAYDLLVLYMANEAEQARGPAGEPGPWLARVSRMGALLPRGAPRVPPLFASCTAVVSPEDEAAARQAYTDAADLCVDPAADVEAADQRFAAAVAACPWPAEPRVLRAYLALRRGDLLGARLELVDARRMLAELGVVWDNRLDYDAWLRLILSLENLSFGQPDATAALPAPDMRRARQTLDAVARVAGETGTPETAGAGGPEEAGRARFHRYVDSFAEDGADARHRFYPGLTSRPWYDPSAFPLARALETHYAEIRRELLELDPAGFHQESERIERTGSWDVLLLYERGRENRENRARCPVTARIIETNNTVRTLAGLIYVSRMRPGTHIAAHRGPTNMRLRCHLGLQVPQGDCAIRVGNDTRGWREGACIVFDDYYEHEAWNHTSEDRVVLIVDLWHPDLTSTEIALLEGLHRYAAAYTEELGRYWSANARAAGSYD